MAPYIPPSLSSISRRVAHYILGPSSSAAEMEQTTRTYGHARRETNNGWLEELFRLRNWVCTSFHSGEEGRGEVVKKNGVGFPGERAKEKGDKKRNPSVIAAGVLALTCGISVDKPFFSSLAAHFSSANFLVRALFSATFARRNLAGRRGGARLSERATRGEKFSGARHFSAVCDVEGGEMKALEPLFPSFFRPSSELRENERRRRRDHQRRREVGSRYWKTLEKSSDGELGG